MKGSEVYVCSQEYLYDDVLIESFVEVFHSKDAAIEAAQSMVNEKGGTITHKHENQGYAFLSAKVDDGCGEYTFLIQKQVVG